MISLKLIETTVINRLERELNPNLFYHNVNHTLDVIHSVRVLTEKEAVSKTDLTLLELAALYHDTGFLERYHDNEEFGVKRAKTELPKYGYPSDQIETVSGLILATKIPQDPKTELQRILCDADLANLGREDFYIKTEQLRRELSIMELREISLREWYEDTLKFLESHNYWTVSAKDLWQNTKEKHIREIRELLGQRI